MALAQMDTPEGRIGKTHGSSEINPRDRLGLMDVPYFLMENVTLIEDRSKHCSKGSRAWLQHGLLMDPQVLNVLLF